MNSILNLPLPLIPLCETAFKFHHINRIHMKPNLYYLCSKVILTIILKICLMHSICIYLQKAKPEIFISNLQHYLQDNLCRVLAFSLFHPFTNITHQTGQFSSYNDLTVVKMISLKEGTQISKNCIHLQTEELALVLEKLMQQNFVMFSLFVVSVYLLYAT